jgi:hypothetical protein
MNAHFIWMGKNGIGRADKGIRSCCGSNSKYQVIAIRKNIMAHWCNNCIGSTNGIGIGIGIGIQARGRDKSAYPQLLLSCPLKLRRCSPAFAVRELFRHFHVL